MKHLVIIGAGPRGLAVALRASLHSELKVTVVDTEPLSTWTFPVMLSDIQMRSPITFDLTTFYPDLIDYSLPSFLGHRIASQSQQEVEDSKLFCYRKDFVNYLKFIVDRLKINGVGFAKHKVVNITDSKVICPSISIEYDYLVMATGRKTQESKLPTYLKTDKLVDIKNLHDDSWESKEINVVGSGQQSAELVEFLARQKAKVTWIQKHIPIVNQYPAPSYTVWGCRTALGNYYSTYCVNKLLYLKRVKEWGPSITPYIFDKLKKLPYDTLVNPQSTEDINLEADFILATGFKQKVGLLTHDFNIERYPLDPDLPKINKDFQSTSHPNIYFTGMLALRYDGPRQGSLISSAFSAYTIINNILNN